MIKGFFKNASIASKIIFSIFIILCVFLLVLIAGTLIALPVFGISIFQLPNVLSDFSNPQSINLLKYFQTIQSLGLFVLPPFLIGYFYSESKSTTYLKLDRQPMYFSIILVAVLMFCVIPFINLLGEVNSWMKLPHFMASIENWMKSSEDNAQRLTQTFLRGSSIGVLLVNIFVVALVPAIGEEMVFRGIFQRLFTEWTQSIHWGVIIAAAFFSFMHFEFYGFLPRMVLGILLGYLFVWSETLWLPIIAHFFNNGIAVVCTFLWNNKMISTDPDKFEATPTSLFIAALSLILAITLLHSIFLHEQKARFQQEL